MANVATPRLGADARADLRTAAVAQRIQTYMLVVSVYAVDVAIRTCGLRTTMNGAQRMARSAYAVARPHTQSPHHDGPTVSAAQRATVEAMRHTLANVSALTGVAGMCLPHAVVAWTWCRARGLNAELAQGVRRVGHRMDAHAWIEVAGTTLSTDPELHTWTALPRMTAEAGW